MNSGEQEQVNENSQMVDTQNTYVTYICGQCGRDNELKPKETTIRCRQCGFRIVYKKQQATKMQFLAR